MSVIKRKVLEQSSNLTLFTRLTPIAFLNNFNDWNSVLGDYKDTILGGDLLFLHRVTDYYLN